MRRSRLFVIIISIISPATMVFANPVPVRHTQKPMHRIMVARSENGETIARGEFSQAVQGSEVTMRITYRFTDGSIDDEVTTYSQQGTFRLVRNHHMQTGPFFSKPSDLTVDTDAGIVTFRTADTDGKIRVESKRMAMPADLSNGMVGTLLLNVPRNAAPFRVAVLAPVGGGRLVQLLISPESDQTVQLGGRTLKATVFRVHPVLNPFVSMFARLIGVQPKDVLVWILEGDDPAVAVVIGQLGGYGPIVSSELVGTDFAE